MSLKESYDKCKTYSDKIMGDVTKALDAKKIKYEVKSNGNEVVITGQSKDKVDKAISKVDVPKTEKSLLLDIVGVKNNVYIRQKTK